MRKIFKKHQFFAGLLSVLVSVFLVSVVTYAATTISANISTAGTVTMESASTTNDFWLGNVIADDDEPSWACDTEGVYDEFFYHFQSALMFMTPSNSHVDADDDNNCFVSIDEAFDYAFDLDSYNPDGGNYNPANPEEHPQIDDDGNGLSQMDGDNNDGGNIADKIFL